MHEAARRPLIDPHNGTVSVPAAEARAPTPVSPGTRSSFAAGAAAANQAVVAEKVRFTLKMYYEKCMLVKVYILGSIYPGPSAPRWLFLSTRSPLHPSLFCPPNPTE